MEIGSIFERVSESGLSRWLNWLALSTVLTGLAGGSILAGFRRPAVRYLVLGALLGMVGPLVALIWHVVDARTSYWDYLYRELNPGRDRLLWPLLGAGRLDSVRNLVGLALGLTLAGAGVGGICRALLRWLDHRFPAEPSPSPQALERPAAGPPEPGSLAEEP